MTNAVKLVLISAGCLVALVLFSSWIFPYTVDSFIYITTAQEIKAGKGLLFQSFFLVPPKPDYLPVVLEPPGYAFLIVALSYLGVNEYMASLVIPRVCFLFFPFLLFKIFSYVTRPTVALVAAFFCVFGFSMIKCSLMAWTDIPYLFFILISFWMAFHLIKKEGKVSLFFILVAGLMAGYAFLIRYVGVVFMLSVLGGGMLSVLLKRFSLKRFIKIFLLYSLGVGAVVVPYLIRNHLVFGTIQPYNVGPSLMPLAVNLNHYFSGLSELIFTARLPGVISMVILLALSVYFIVCSRRQFKLNPEVLIFGFILGGYFVFYSAFLIYYKTKMFGSEDIGERYLIQIAWLLILAITIGVDSFLTWFNKHKPIDIKAIVGLLMLIFVIMQSLPAINAYVYNRNINNLTAKLKQYVPLINNFPKDHLIVSNIADITFLLTKRQVRLLSNYSPETVASTLRESAPFIVMLIKGQEFYHQSFGYHPAWQNPPGYRQLYTDENIDLFMVSPPAF